MHVARWLVGASVAVAVAYGCRDAVGPGDAPVAAVSVTPGALRLEPGTSTRLDATLLDAEGRALSGREVFWASQDEDVAAVSSTGMVTARGPGTVRIAASSEGRSGFAELVVSARVARIAITPERLEIAVGTSVPLRATPMDAGGVSLLDRPVTWATSNAGVASVSPDGIVTAEAPGSAVISAESEGVTGFAPIVVRVVPVASVVISPARLTLEAGRSAALTARVIDAGGLSLGDRTVLWSSSNPAVAVVSNAGLVIARAAGEATITANSEGRTATAVVTVRDAAIASLGVIPGDGAVFVGATLQLTAVPRDAEGTLLFGRDARWQSSNPAVATVSASGLVTGVSPGSVQISAVMEERTATATIAVSFVPPTPPASVASITLVPQTERLTVGSSAQLAATPRDADGSPLPGRTVIWASDDPDVAAVTQSGMVTGIAPGSAVITATSEGQSASSTITVVPQPVVVPPDPPPPPPRAPVHAVVVSSASANLIVGDAMQLSVSVTDAQGSALTDRAVEWRSSNPAIVSISGTGLAVALAPGSATLVATSEGVSGSVSITVAPPPAPRVPVHAVIVTPPSARLVAEEAVQLAASTRDAEGNTLTGRLVTWASSDPNIVTVSATGLVTAVARGVATVTATSEGIVGAASIIVSPKPPPPPPPVHSVAVTPSLGRLAVGAQLQLAATPRDAQGNALADRIVEWRTSDPRVATVSATGLVTAVGAGSATISASSEGRQGSAQIVVDPPPPPAPVPVALVRVSPPTASLEVGASLQLAAVPFDAEGHALSDRRIEWRSADARVATVSATGLVTTVAAGTVVVSALSETVTGAATITVTLPPPPPPVPVRSVTVTPAGGTLLVGATLQLTATPRDEDGNGLSGREVTWRSSDTRIATVSATGLVTAVAPGAASISAVSEGVTGAAAVTVTAPPPPPPPRVASVAISPSSGELVEGTTLQLTATVRDDAGNILTDRVVQWRSSNPARAAVSQSGLVTAVAPGAVVISATVEGVSAGARFVVTPKPPPRVATVTVSPSAWSMLTGATVQLAATTRDDAGNLLTGREVAWTTSDATVARVSASGLVTAVGAGTARVTATSEGQSGAATITVSVPPPPPPAPVRSVTVTPSSSTMFAGSTLALTATLRDAEGNVLTGRPVEWRTSNAAVATVSATGVVTAHAPGVVVITAISEGRSGTSTILVRQVPVARVVVSPSSVTLDRKESRQLSATLYDADGRVLTGREVTWSSSDPKIATVSATGLVVGVKKGDAIITATSEGRSGTATVRVK